MLDKKSSASAYSFTVSMPTTRSEKDDENDASWLDEGKGSASLSTSLPESRGSATLRSKSLYDTGDKFFASRRIDRQKVVTFFRESDSEEPELRIIIDARKYTNLEMLIDELSRILSLRDREKNIYNQSGRILRRVEDFEDGASYFFSFSANDERFIQALSVVNNGSETPREKAKNNWKKILNRKKRMINVISNENSSTPWRVLIDETKLQSFSQLLHELNLIIQPKDGRVFRLCTSKGRRVRSLGEMFLGTDTFVAIVSSIGMADGAGMDQTFRENRKITPRKQTIHNPSKYDIITGEGSHLERRLINIKGRCHVFHPPSHAANWQLKAKARPPEKKLQLDWVYGYNGQKSRDNVFVLQSEELMYCVASVVVIYDVYRHKQRYYAEHTMKITCMALHPNKWYVATGQVAPENYNIEVVDHIRIWNAEMLNTLAILTLEEQILSVTCLAFSLEDYGRKLASVDSDGHNFRLAVWNWNSKEILAQSQSYEEEEYSVKFQPHSNKSLLSVGKSHIFYWNWRGSILEKYKGHFFDCDVPRWINCFVYTSSGDAIAGDSNGNLHFWQEGSRKTKNVIKNAHMGSIQSMFLLSHDILITYGSGDNLLSLWETRKLERHPTATIQITGDHGAVTSIAVSPNHHDYNVGDTEMFLGTSKNQILHGTFKTQFSPLIKGHEKETTSIAANPCYNHFVSVGLDGHVIYRSLEDSSILWEKKIEFPATSAAFYPYGNVVAIGMDSGRWCILSSEDGSHIASFQSGKDPLTAITYSLEGGDVALGTANGEVYLFSVYDEGHSYRLVSSVECNSEKITAIDWSKDGTHLRTMTDEWDQNILNTEYLSEVGDLKVIADLRWQTQKSTLSYATSGIWRPGSDLRFPSADCCSSRDLLCVGSEYGHVRLYDYPCWKKQANYREYSLHVGRVNAICFLPSEIHVVSSGQYDNAVLQWRIVFGKASEAGVKTGFMREHTMEDQLEGWHAREQASSVGHRKLRRADSRTSSSSERDPFARPTSTSLKATGVEKIADDYREKTKRMSQDEIQEYLNGTGKGVLQRDVALRKSHDFLAEYNVQGPVTKEQKQRRKQGKYAATKNA